MAIIAGIDEAGYGPMLGPMVLSRVALWIGNPNAAQDLWDLLADGVARGIGRRERRVVVADSKAIYSSQRGIGPLEENVLAFLGWARAGKVKDFLQLLGEEVLESEAPCPWYRDLSGTIPIAASAEVVEQKRRILARCMQAADVTFCGARCVPVSEAEFNLGVQRTGNKGAFLSAKAAFLMRELWERFGEEEILLIVDKHGGRNNYRQMLYASFPDCRIKALLESMGQSLYEISKGGRFMRVSMEAKADGRHLPVAAASMISKYVRELFMAQFNAYWQARVPGLKPTAGYPEDARRFLKEIEPARRAEGIPRAIFVRCR